MTAQRTTRKPTGKPPWPIVLLAGVGGSGKTYRAAEASASDLVARTLWVGIGENDPDEYGKIPGARFEIVDHDGTYRDTLAALKWASGQPRVDGKPNLLVLDSHGRAWDLLSDMAQAEANRRRKDPSGEARIASDLWNLAKRRWDDLFDVLIAHDGPVILTAKLERQTVFTEAGDPTKEKQNKVKAQKGLAFDVDVVVEFPEPFPGGAYITKARSLTFTADPAAELPTFTVDELWRRLGLADPAAVGQRTHASTVIADAEPDTADRARDALRALCIERRWDLAEALTTFGERYGADLRTTNDPEPVRAFMAELVAAADAEQAATTERTNP